MKALGTMEGNTDFHQWNKTQHFPNTKALKPVSVDLNAEPVHFPSETQNAFQNYNAEGELDRHCEGWKADLLSAAWQGT